LRTAWFQCSEELEKISDAIIDSEEYVGAEVVAAAKDAIRREFDDIERSAAETDSESTLTDRITSLEKLALRGGVAPAVLSSAIETVNRRIAELSEEAETAEPPSFSGAAKPDIDKFDDAALANLFAPLLEH
jgi:hypothetical protein